MRNNKRKSTYTKDNTDDCDGSMSEDDDRSRAGSPQHGDKHNKQKLKKKHDHKKKQKQL